ncbi:MAG TPA: zinc-binding dehydrogenase [Gaiellaceae bacterium]|nr:zinc-binding dehydrogenase [Gaiellaceae bacterium]
MRGFLTDPAAPDGLRLAGDLPEPAPGPGELLLDVRAFAVNRGELRLLEQRPDGWRPGQDVAGVVLRAAADGSGPQEGARVVAIVDGAGWAERVAVPTQWAAQLPEAVSVEQAASLPIAGLTALRALRVDGPILGRRVLVTGATGGVGQFAVQLAAAGGAHVTAQVSGPERAEEARSLGADEVVTSLDGEALGPFELVLDGIGGPQLRDVLHRLVPGGTVALYGGLGGPSELALPDFRGAPGARVMGFFHAYPQDEKGADLATLAQFVAGGQLVPLLGLVEDWERTPEVLDALRGRRVRGKAVLVRS